MSQYLAAHDHSIRLGRYWSSHHDPAITSRYRHHQTMQRPKMSQYKQNDHMSSNTHLKTCTIVPSALVDVCSFGKQRLHDFHRTVIPAVFVSAVSAADPNLSDELQGHSSSAYSWRKLNPRYATYCETLLLDSAVRGSCRSPDL